MHHGVKRWNVQYFASFTIITCTCHTTTNAVTNKAWSNKMFSSHIVLSMWKFQIYAHCKLRTNKYIDRWFSSFLQRLRLNSTCNYKFICNLPLTSWMYFNDSLPTIYDNFESIFTSRTNDNESQLCVIAMQPRKSEFFNHRYWCWKINGWIVCEPHFNLEPLFRFIFYPNASVVFFDETVKWVRSKVKYKMLNNACH